MRIVNWQQPGKEKCLSVYRSVYSIPGIISVLRWKTYIYKQLVGSSQPPATVKNEHYDGPLHTSTHAPSDGVYVFSQLSWLCYGRGGGKEMICRNRSLWLDKLSSVTHKHKWNKVFYWTNRACAPSWAWCQQIFSVYHRCFWESNSRLCILTHRCHAALPTQSHGLEKHGANRCNTQKPPPEKP